MTVYQKARELEAARKAGIPLRFNASTGRHEVDASALPTRLRVLTKHAKLAYSDELRRFVTVPN